MEKLEVKSVRKYKAGYEVREELWKYSEVDLPATMKSAYTVPENDYIGLSKNAHYLIVKRGIKPQKRTEHSTVCSIGFCEKENKWYGWSHRAIYGFTIGDTIKQGDSGFEPSNKEEFTQQIQQFYNILNSDNQCFITDEGIEIKGPNLDIVTIEPYPEVWGKGEWTAQTLDDAKQMAMDFAKSVS